MLHIINTLLLDKLFHINIVNKKSFCTLNKALIEAHVSYKAVCPVLAVGGCSKYNTCRLALAPTALQLLVYF